jgi:Ca2+-binding RTX toxin-like protein
VYGIKTTARFTEPSYTQHIANGLRRDRTILAAGLDALFRHKAQKTRCQTHKLWNRARTPGKRTLWLSDRTFAVTATTVAWGGPTVTYSGLAALTINGGTGADTFNVSSTSATAAVTIAGGSGNNTLVWPNTTSTWNITALKAPSRALWGVAQIL